MIKLLQVVLHVLLWGHLPDVRRVRSPRSGHVMWSYCFECQR